MKYYNLIDAQGNLRAEVCLDQCEAERFCCAVQRLGWSVREIPPDPVPSGTTIRLIAAKEELPVGVIGRICARYKTKNRGIRYTCRFTERRLGRAHSLSRAEFETVA